MKPEFRVNRNQLIIVQGPRTRTATFGSHAEAVEEMCRLEAEYEETERRQAELDKLYADLNAEAAAAMVPAEPTSKVKAKPLAKTKRPVLGMLQVSVEPTGDDRVEVRLWNHSTEPVVVWRSIGPRKGSVTVEPGREIVRAFKAETGDDIVLRLGSSTGEELANLSV